MDKLRYAAADHCDSTVSETDVVNGLIRAAVQVPEFRDGASVSSHQNVSLTIISAFTDTDSLVVVSVLCFQSIAS
jgi:hypothetical protein